MYAVRRILVPIDYSNVSRAAISSALQLAHANADLGDVAVVLLHVQRTLDARLGETIETPDTLPGLFEGIAADEAGMLEAAELEYTRAAEGGRPLKRARLITHVAGGDWVDVATQLITEFEIDLIVAGTHGGAKGLRGFFFGSDTERLVSRSTCSVFVVKPKGFPYLRD
jgi:nucleotide-binding universal stress UspA family protein